MRCLEVSISFLHLIKSDQSLANQVVNPRDLCHLQTLATIRYHLFEPAKLVSTFAHTDQHVQLCLDVLFCLMLFTVILKDSQRYAVDLKCSLVEGF